MEVREGPFEFLRRRAAGREPMGWLPLPWRWRLEVAKRTYDVGVPIAKRVCRGNKYGDHTPLWPAKQPVGGSCLCARVRRRLDYIPF